MKIKDMLQPNQKLEVYAQLPTTFFAHLTDVITPTALLTTVQYMFYVTHSAEKTPTKFFLDYFENRASNYVYLANFLKGMFGKKWSSFNAVLIAQYDPLNSKDMKKTTTNNLTETTTYGKALSKTKEGSVDKEYDNNIETDNEVSTKETITRGSNVQDNIFGFNSVASVGQNSSDENTTETTEGNKDDNQEHTLRKQTGTDRDIYDLIESENYSGDDIVKDTGTTEDVTKGRDISAQELIEEEIRIRNEYLLAELILDDINSVLTLSVYN